MKDIINRLDKKKSSNCWMSAEKSNYTDTEVFVQYRYNESIEDCVKRAFSDQDATEIYSVLKQSGRTLVLRRIYCFINMITRTLEVYRGKDTKTDEITAMFERLLETRITPITLRSEELQKLYSMHSTELNQAMFRNIDGLFYEILRGNSLQDNQKFKDYADKFTESLRVISFRPKIRFLNGNNRYQITVNGDKGTVKFSNQENEFRFRPRFEIRQITFMIASILGIIAS